MSLYAYSYLRFASKIIYRKKMMTPSYPSNPLTYAHPTSLICLVFSLCIISSVYPSIIWKNKRKTVKIYRCNPLIIKRLMPIPCLNRNWQFHHISQNYHTKKPPQNPDFCIALAIERESIYRRNFVCSWGYSNWYCLICQAVIHLFFHLILSFSKVHLSIPCPYSLHSQFMAETIFGLR